MLRRTTIVAIIADVFREIDALPFSHAGAPPGHMQIFACNASSPNQVFDYTVDMTLRGRLTGLCITATTGGSAQSPLWPAPCVDGDPSQFFTFEGNGHVRLVNKTACDYQPCAAGTCCECFDVLGGGVASGTELGLFPCATPTAPNEAFTYDAQTGLLRGTESGLCADAGSAAPQPLLASYFQDHMVLQRGAPSPVWGFAPPGASVLVSFRGEAQGAAAADANGTWRLALPAMPASAVGANLTASRADGSASRTIVDVLVGDVYVASGQCEERRAGRQDDGLPRHARPHPLPPSLPPPAWLPPAPGLQPTCSSRCTRPGTRLPRSQQPRTTPPSAS